MQAASRPHPYPLSERVVNRPLEAHDSGVVRTGAHIRKWVGQRAEYEIGEGRKGPEAQKVRAV